MFATVVAPSRFRVPLEPTADGPAMFTAHYHWAPSPEFRVRFKAADPTVTSSTVNTPEEQTRRHRPAPASATS